MQRGFQRRAILRALAVAAILGRRSRRAPGSASRSPVFHERRARLIRDTGGDGVIVLYGYGEADVAASVTSFRQNEEFYYLTGWNEPEAIMLLEPKAHASGAAPELGRRDPVYSARTTARKRNGRDPSWRRRTLTRLPARDFLRFATFRNLPPTSRKRSRAFPKFTRSSRRNPRAEKIASRRTW